MVIIAWKKVELVDILQAKVLLDLSTIFITAAVLRFIQSMISSLAAAMLIYFEHIYIISLFECYAACISSF